jgi:small subunit ribosomal protein S6
MKKMHSNLYEGVYIFSTTLSDDARQKALAKVTACIENLGGQTEKILDWGRRKLAYSINKHREGNYYLVYFRLPTNAISELIEANLINEDLLKFMNVTTEQVPEGDEIVFKQLVKS